LDNTFFTATSKCSFFSFSKKLNARLHAILRSTSTRFFQLGFNRSGVLFEFKNAGEQGIKEQRDDERLM
jgi:hypothetical protein